jgi:hypothetical protein
MYSGRFAAINGIGNVASWNVKETNAEDKIVNSATKAGTDRILGTKDCTGSYEAHGGAPAVFPGDTFQFIGYTSPTSDVAGTVGMRYTVDAIVTQVVVQWDFAKNTIVKHTVQFGGKGLLGIASGAAIVDSTSVKKAKSSDCAFVSGAAVPFLTTRTTATLTISNSASAYANAATSGSMTRERGTLDWTLAIPAHGHTQLATPGTHLQNLKLGVNATESWWFSDALVGDTTDITCKPGTDQVDTQTVNVAMLASHPTTGVVGFIRKPGETVANVWPYTN